MKKVYCVGLLVCDIPLRPVPSSIFAEDNCRIEAPEWNTGGDAANVAVALSRLGAHAIFTGLLGKDMYGRFLAQSLKEAGVDIRGLREHPSLGTGTSHILIEPGGERHFLVHGELNSILDYSYVSEDLIAEADIVYLGSCMCMNGMDSGGTAELFRKAKSLGKITITDFGGNGEARGDYWLKYLDQVLRNCDYLMPSYIEAVALTGKKELSEMREVLSPYGAKALVVKLGAQGCYLTDFKDEWRIPAFQEFKPVDTTGAGDSFVAGFIRGLIEGWEPKEAAVFASCVAGHNVTKVGATAGVPDFDTAYRYISRRSVPRQAVSRPEPWHGRQDS